MTMVVMMLVKADGARGLRTEQPCIFGVLRHRMRHTRAADVMVETDHAIALCHDDMQVMRDQQHAEAALGAQATNQRVKFGFPA